MIPSCFLDRFVSYLGQLQETLSRLLTGWWGDSARLDSQLWIPSFGFKGLDSWVWIPGSDSLVWMKEVGFLGLDSWVWILWFAFLGLHSWV